MKKIILILNVFITILALSSCENPHQKEPTTSFESSSDATTIDIQETTNMDDFSSKIIYVQERVSEIIDDDCFQNSCLNDKVQLVEPVLNELIEQGYITDYEINLEQRIPYITLFYDGGGTSTIFLEAFPEYEN